MWQGGNPRFHSNPPSATAISGQSGSVAVSTALSQATKKAAPGRSGLRLAAGARDTPRVGLLGDFGNHARANGTTAFADREAQTVFHRDGGDQLHVELQVVARHNHFSAFWQLNGTGDVCGPEVELWTVCLLYTSDAADE